ncbi:hypothetical protein KAU11_05045, partial [Candidatus Babeliales bacterium]|nr:hypothetical protein [Candidatus Babeliales bacterium]
MDTFSRKKKGLFFSVLIACLTFFAYITSVQTWGFWGDDFSIAYNCNIESLSELPSFFYARTNSQCSLPTNLKSADRLTFFQVSYRPVVTFFYMLQMKLLGFKNTFGVLIISLFSFCLCVAIFFYLLTLLVPIWLAFVGTMFFAFHPVLGEDFAQMNVQPLFWTTILIIFTCLFLKRWIVKKSWLAGGFSSFLFACTLFMYEAFFTFPIWLLFAIPLYFYRTVRPIVWREILGYTVPFWGVLIFYLIVRCQIYPLAFGVDGVMFDPVSVWSKFFSFQYLVDFVWLWLNILGLSALPRAMPLLKCGFLILWSTFFFLSFLKSKRKKEILLFLLGALLLYWPAIFMAPRGYFTYIALPPFIIALIIAFSERVYSSYLGIAFMLMLSCHGMLSNRAFLRMRSKKIQLVHNSLSSFLKKDEVQGQSLFFVGIPSEIFPAWGLAPAVWMYRGNDTLPVYSDSCLQTRTHLSSVILESMNLPQITPVNISIKRKTLRMTSTDHSQCFFWGGLLKTCSMGKRTVYSYADGKAFDFELEIDDKWLYSNPIFVTWDFENQKMRIL